MKVEVREELWLKWRTNVRAFVEDVLSQHITNNIPAFHKEIYKMLLKTKALVLAAPRGFAKSYIISFFYPLHQALFEKKRDITIISASESLAIEWLRKIKFELETNSWILHVFGDLKGDKWTETHIILKNGINIRAKGAGAQIRGFRPDLIVLDDIETDESVISEDQRTKLRNWVFKACINALTPDGQFIWIGTIIHPLALIEEQLCTDNGWEKHRFQAYKDGVQEQGHELWPDRWTHEKLQARKKEIGSFAFASEYMNDPVCNENAPIKEHQIRFWKELPDQYSCVISVDPAYSDDEKADYKVASLIAIDHHHNRYLVSYIRTHRPTGEFIDAILNLYLQNKDTLTGIGIPCQGTEREFYKSVVQKAEARHLYPPFIELKNTFRTGTDRTARKKTDRIIAALQPLFESGKYYIHETHGEARDELLTIGASRWDDLVDSFAYAEQILSPVYFEPETPKRGRYGELMEDELPAIQTDYGYEI